DGNQTRMREHHVSSVTDFLYCPNDLARALGALCEPGGLRTVRFTSRLTQRTRWAGSLALLVMMASAPVFCSVRPSGSTKPDRRMIRAFGSSRRIRWISSPPFILGIWESVTNT